MDIFWQQVLVGVAVGLAVTYLIIRYVRRRRRQAGCASCPVMRDLDERQRPEND
ncbi:MAG: hypothetical protein ABII79_06825 [bacterium]